MEYEDYIESFAYTTNDAQSLGGKDKEWENGYLSDESRLVDQAKLWSWEFQSIGVQPSDNIDKALEM